MTEPFVHLHVHSEFSIYDSVIRHKDLVAECVKKDQPAVAVTDLNNLFGVVKFYQKAMQSGIKPIIGVEVWLQSESPRPAKWLLLCQSNHGLDLIRQLISKAYSECERFPVPILPVEWVVEGIDEVIAILIEDQQLLVEPKPQAIARLKSYHNAYGDRFYLGLSHVNPHMNMTQVIELASETQTPVVATNSVMFLNPNDFEAHEARVCIQEGTTLAQPREKAYSQDQYLTPNEQMQAWFEHVPSALANTVEIAKRCNVQLSLGKAFLPDFPVPESHTVETYLRALSNEGLQKRMPLVLQAHDAPDHDDVNQAYQERLDIELEVIISMGFPGYFLIVADFIQWAKRHDIPVGPGRGSGAGSIVAWALEITDLDPIEYDLLFERFLNPERVSMPDFDIDFCMDRRDDVIDYVAQKYGRQSVSQIATFGTMAAKAVVRDVGRVLGHPYGFVDKIAKLIPFEIGMTLDKALIEEDMLKQRYQSEEEVKILIDLARKLEGLTRNVGKHAGGVVIAPDRLTEFTPMYCEQGSEQAVTQYDKDDVEAAGLVKFDFLGLRTLTIIQWAVQNVNRYLSDEKINIADIPIDCPKTFELLKACQTTAVFQLESRGMKELIHRLQPDQFEEIIALVALFRPGPLQSGMVDDFIDRKHGRAVVEYPHPELEPILESTYGVILYQEQVMQIAQSLAGYTLGGADLLRRAMGKKKPEEMAKQREIFQTGATERGIEAETATYIFDLMEKFAGYGFNKSHSAAYALVSYQTAWLKAHYPNAFMAAVLSSDMGNTDKVVIFVSEVRHMKLTLLNPDVNHSYRMFTLNDRGDIVYGLGAIKGVGDGAIDSIVQARKDGAFTDLFDFCQRIDCKKANRRVLEALIQSGAMDSLGQSRAILEANLDTALKVAEKKLSDEVSGQVDMFSLEESTSEPEYVSAPEWDELTRLQHERDTLGLYLSGHPVKTLQQELSHVVTHPLNQLPNRETKVVVAGIVTQMRTLMTKKGDRMAFVTLEDEKGQFEVAIFSDLFEAKRECLKKDAFLIVMGTSSFDQNAKQLRLRCEDIMDLANARGRWAKRLKIKVRPERHRDFPTFIEGLKQVFQEQMGPTPVTIEYYGEVHATMPLSQQWRVLPSEHLIKLLKEELGKDALTLEY